MHTPFQTKKARIVLLIGAMLLVFLIREGFGQTMNLHIPGGSVHKNTPQKSYTAQTQAISQAAQWNSQSIEVNAQPTVMPTRTVQPTATPNKATQPTATATGQCSTTGSTGAGVRYFPVG